MRPSVARTCKVAHDGDGGGYDGDGGGYDSDGGSNDSDGGGNDSDGGGYDSDGGGYDSDGGGNDSDGGGYDPERACAPPMLDISVRNKLFNKYVQCSVEQRCAVACSEVRCLRM